MAGLGGTGGVGTGGSGAASGASGTGGGGGAGGVGTGGSGTTGGGHPFPDEPIGFASLNGGTVGGLGGEVVTVCSYSELQSYAESSSRAVITVAGAIFNVSEGGRIDVQSNKSIIGGAMFGRPELRGAPPSRPGARWTTPATACEWRRWRRRSQVEHGTRSAVHV